MENRNVAEKASVVDLISLLLKEPKIKQKIFEGLKPEAKEYDNWEFNEKLQRVRFGKHSWGGFGGFWNNLIKCYDHISLSEFYIKVWDALVEMTAGMPAHEAVLEGLSREVLMQGIRQNDFNILQRFYDVCRHLTNDGYWKNQNSKVNDRLRNRKDSSQYASEVEVEVEPRCRNIEPTTIRVVDSVGKAFEVLSVKWVGR